MEPERLVAQSSFDHFLESDERTSAQEKNVRSVNWEELLVRMFAATLWRNVRDCSFEDLQERLLHTFAGHIACDRGVLILATNLVNLVDIYKALLRAFDIAVSRLQEFENDVIDVFTNVTGFGQRSGIDDRERNAQHARERLCKQRFARAGRPNQENVCFLNLDVGTTAAEFDSLVVLIHSDGQAFLGFILADHVFV